MLPEFEKSPEIRGFFVLGAGRWQCSRPQADPAPLAAIAAQDPSSACAGLAASPSFLGQSPVRDPCNPIRFPLIGDISQGRACLDP